MRSARTTAAPRSRLEKCKMELAGRASALREKERSIALHTPFLQIHSPPIDVSWSVAYSFTLTHHSPTDPPTPATEQTNKRTNTLTVDPNVSKTSPSSGSSREAKPPSSSRTRCTTTSTHSTTRGRDAPLIAEGGGLAKLDRFFEGGEDTDASGDRAVCRNTTNVRNGPDPLAPVDSIPLRASAPHAPCICASAPDITYKGNTPPPLLRPLYCLCRLPLHFRRSHRSLCRVHVLVSRGALPPRERCQHARPTVWSTRRLDLDTHEIYAPRAELDSHEPLRGAALFVDNDRVTAADSAHGLDGGILQEIDG
ncbi:hypothetical protein B0H12DRAFT_277026 [Mycena haematopus]|nr:hypothetical protein B0H12DRAFT_277026 [Mycena haematopus]